MGRGHQRLAQAFQYEARESWEWSAACIGKEEYFFPEKGQAGLARKAKAICESCVVLEECHAKVQADPPEYGVWAGRLYQPNGRPPQPDEE